MKIISSIILIFILPFYLFTQEQVSNIQNIILNDWFQLKGFTFIDDTEYLIEWSHDLTKISTIKDQEVQLIHEIDFKPDPENWLRYGDFTTHNSPLIIRENKLYEIYPKDIVIIDIVDGNIVEHFDLSSFEIEIIYDINILENFIVFQERSGSYFRFDMETEVLDKISLSENMLVYPIGERIYAPNQEKTALYYYDILSGEEFLFVENEATFNRIDYIESENSHALFLMDESNKKFILTHSHKFEEITCIDHPNDQLGGVYFNDEIMAYELLQNGKHSIHVMNVEDCEEILAYDSSHPEWFGIIRFYDNKLRDKDYLFYSKAGGLFEYGEHYIVDLVNKKNFHLPILSNYADFLYTKEVIRQDSILCIKTHNEVDFYPSIHSLIKINLRSHEVDPILIPDADFPNEFIMGEGDGSSKLSMFVGSHNSSDIWDYDFMSDEYMHLKDLYYPINLGIQYLSEFFSFENDQYFFVAGGIYKMSSNSIEKIMAVDWVSGMTLYGNDLCFLARQQEKYYTVKLDLSNHSIDSSFLDGFTYIDYRRPKTDFAIINIPNTNHDYNTGWFDIRQNKWKKLKYNGEIIRTSRFTVSGNNLLYKGRHNYQNPWMYFLLNTETRETQKINEFEDLHPNILPDHEGGFYMLPHASNSYKDLKKIHPDGTVSTIIEAMSEKKYQQDYVALDGPVKTIPMQGEDEVLFLSEKDGEFIQYRIPYEGTLYYIPFFYKEVGDILVAQLGNSEQKQSYIVRYGEDPVAMLPETDNYELLDVIFEEDKLILFYYDEQRFVIKHYDLIEGILVDGIDVECAKEQSYKFFEKYIKINSGQYLISFNDGMSGKEPWIYDKKEKTIKKLSDLYPGKVGSEPDNFIAYDNYIYFTALDPLKIRQWFRWDKTSNIEPVISDNRSLIVFPNPSSDKIQFDRDLKFFSLFDSSGKKIFSQDNYKKSSLIDIVDLKSGQYYIFSRSLNDKALIQILTVVKN